MPVRCFSASIRRKSSAIMLADQTMSCRLPVQRAFPAGFRFWSLSNARPFLNLAPSNCAQLAPAAMTLARVEGLEAHRHSVGIRLNIGDGMGSDKLKVPPDAMSSSTKPLAARRRMLSMSVPSPFMT